MAVIAGVVVGSPLPALADEVPLDPANSSDLIHIELSAPLNLDDAASIGAQQAEEVVGYYFDNGQVVGEFYPGVQDVADFKAEFMDEYGTQPAITQLVALSDDPSEVPTSAVQSASASNSTKRVSTRKAPFKPRPINKGKLKSLFASTSAPAQTKADSPVKFAAAAASPYGSWAPDTVNVQILRSGSHQYVNNILTWNVTSNNKVPAEFGMEVGTNFISTTLPSNRVRSKEDRYCDGVDVGPSYRKAKFIGANYAWSSWSATSSEGKVGAGKPYADYNDLFDKCNLQSMTIGFRYPRLIPGDKLITRIDAPRGGVDSNKISGDISLVHDDCGSSNGSGAGGLTDCMGLRDIDPPPSAHNPRLTLNASRGWSAAPEKCWTSGDFGTGTPAAYSCP